ncbi:DUF6770 family protein [Lacinutrix chionoecetis]
MKNIAILFTILLSCMSVAQTSKAEFGSKVFSSTGVFTNDYNEAVGYYNISRSENKNEDKTYDYIVIIRDNNFNPIAEKTISFSRNSLFIGSAYNGDYLALCIYDMKAGAYKIKIFDRQSNASIDKTVAYETKKEINKTQKNIYLGEFAQSVDFVALKNQGFLLTYPGDYGVVSGGGFNTKAAIIKTDQATSKNTLTLPVERKHLKRGTILRLEILASNNKHVAFKKLDGSYSLNIFDANSGNLNFSTKDKELDSVYINKAFFKDSGNLVVIGNYFKDKKDRHNNKSLGFFYQEITPNGKIIKFHKNNWDDVLSKFSNVKKNNKLKDVGYLYLHNVLEHNNGYLAIFETYKLTRSAKKILLSNSYDNKQLTTNDAFIFNFDKDFNVINVKRVEKQISRWQGASSSYTARYNAERAARYGGFDFLYHQKDVNRNRYYFYFYDYERKKKEKNGFAIKTAIFEDGEFFEDKLNIASISSEHKVLPAEIGEILVLEFFKKEEKFNIRKERFSLD